MQSIVAKAAAETKLPLFEALASMVAAYAYQFTGQWKKAHDAFLRSEALFRDRCIGATFELASVRGLLFRILASEGDFAELARRSEVTLREAELRNDIYTVVNTRCSATSLLAVVRDDTAAAQRELDLAKPHLSKHGFHVQHYFYVLAQAQLSVYRGAADEAVAAIEASRPLLRRSMLLRVQSIRIQINEVHARACIAAATRSGADTTHLLRRAETCIRAVEREKMPWADPSAELLRAGICHIHRQRDRALAHLEAAEAGFAAADMPLLQAVAQRRRGLVLGGDAGHALREAGEAWMSAHGIANPDRMTAAYSPGFES